MQPRYRCPNCIPWNNSHPVNVRLQHNAKNGAPAYADDTGTTKLMPRDMLHGHALSRLYTEAFLVGFVDPLADLDDVEYTSVVVILSILPLCIVRGGRVHMGQRSLPVESTTPSRLTPCAHPKNCRTRHPQLRRQPAVDDSKKETSKMRCRRIELNAVN